MENTVTIDDDLNLEIDKHSQICKDVKIYAQKSNPTFKIKVLNSTIIGNNPVELSGNLVFVSTTVIPEAVEDKKLTFYGNTSQPLVFENSFVFGNLNIEGSLYAENLSVHGTGSLKGSLFNRVTTGINTWLFPIIENAELSGESDIDGYYFISRNLHDTKVHGSGHNQADGALRLTIVDVHNWHINKGTLSGPMYIAGRVDYNVTIQGYGLQGDSQVDYGGIHLTANSRLWSNASAKGAAYILNSNFGGNLTGSIRNNGIMNIVNSSISNTTISGVPYIYNSSLADSTVTDHPSIMTSSFSNSNFTCDAVVFNEGGVSKSFGCGYVSEESKNTSSKLKNEYFSEGYDTAELENYMLEKKEAIQRKYH